MKYLYLIYFLFPLACTSQIKVHLPTIAHGKYAIYSYYPQNDLGVHGLIEDNRATLNTNQLKKGFYSLYVTSEEAYNEKNYVDFIVSDNESQFEIVWIPEIQWHLFVDAPINLKHKNLLENYQRLSRDFSVLNYALEKVENVDIEKVCHHALSSIYVEVNERLNELRKINIAELAYMMTLFKTLLPQNNDSLSDNSYGNWFFCSPFMNQLIDEYVQDLIPAVSSESELNLRLIDKLCENFGSSAAGLDYLDNYFDVNYNYNRSNDIYFYALEKLSALPNLNKVQKTRLQLNLNYARQLLTNSELSSELSSCIPENTKETDVVVIFYASGCKQCSEKFQSMQELCLEKTCYSICVNCDSQLESDEQFGSIQPIHVQNTKKLYPYFFRGTPSVLYLVLRGGIWKIEKSE